MKYNTFITLVIGAGVLVGGGLLYTISGAIERSNAAREQEAREQLQREHELRETIAANYPADDDLEQIMRRHFGRPAYTDKIKDFNEGRGVKINLYAEDGVWTRAKVDHDRDDKWDEKWRWDNGTIYRQLAALDDEVYGVERAIGASTPPAHTSTVVEPAQPLPSDPSATDELRDVDRLMLELLERPVVDKIKDASKGRPFKINLYSDDGQRFNRAKVDLDRDDKWDEKWDFEADGSVTRKVSSADDDATYDQRFVLEAGARWQAVSE